MRQSGNDQRQSRDTQQHQHDPGKVGPGHANVDDRPQRIGWSRIFNPQHLFFRESLPTMPVAVCAAPRGELDPAAVSFDPDNPPLTDAETR
jgi:hypothetical protein